MSEGFFVILVVVVEVPLVEVEEESAAAFVDKWLGEEGENENFFVCEVGFFFSFLSDRMTGEEIMKLFFPLPPPPLFPDV